MSASRSFADDRVALWEVACRYARGVDRNDVALFLSAFTTDGELVLHHTADHDRPERRYRGHDELAAIPARVGRSFTRTFHMLGTAAYAVEGDTATGEVYCTARHFRTSDGGATDLVMHIRYVDDYRRDGEWRIVRRRHYLDWTETLTADPLTA